MCILYLHVKWIKHIFERINDLPHHIKNCFHFNIRITCQNVAQSSKTFYSQSGLGTTRTGQELVWDAEFQNLKCSWEGSDAGWGFYFEKISRWSCEEILVTNCWVQDWQRIPLKEKDRQLGTHQLQLLLSQELVFWETEILGEYLTPCYLLPGLYEIRVTPS